ncbi:MAG TPA: exodeoxyribonuclease VII small subunit [Ilumatobacteraceae bacterium]|nr:exodeoxyribonuclease VII small subunit [Ilumatobacteraceae bacterium]
MTQSDDLNREPPAGYAEAIAELDDILGALERRDVDVDVLAAKVQRAAILIAFCRERIGSARMQIEQVVAELGDDQ